MTTLATRKAGPVATLKKRSPRLTELTARLQQNMRTWGQQNLDWLAVKEEKLYLELDYKSFNEYMIGEWDIDPSRGWQLIRAAKILKGLEGKTDVLPQNEYATRALNGLPEEHRADAWNEAVEINGGEHPRASQVAAVVAAKATEAAGENSTRVDPRPDRDVDPVGYGRSIGAIPDTATATVIEPEGGTDPEPETAPKAPLTDAEWLAAMPERAKIAEAIRGVFDADALYYRETADALKAFGDSTRKLRKEARRACPSGQGSRLGYVGLLEWFLRTCEPEFWQACNVCNGTGYASYGECKECEGRAYHVTRDRA